MGQVREQANEFLNLINKLRFKGHKMNEIAAILQLHSPVLSSMYKTVFPAIINPKPSLNTEEAILEAAFDLVNNLSKDKTTRKLQGYINILKSIPEEKGVIESGKDIFSPYKNAIAASYESMCKSFTGLFECYTHSANSPEIKKEPFLIRNNSYKKTIEVRKGNQMTEHSFEGFMFLGGSHFISIHLIDSKESIQETGLIHLTLPFTRSFVILQGIYMNLSIAKMPVARRIVLRKVGEECSIDEFNEIPTHYYQTSMDSPGISREIMDYLSNANDIVQCMQLPYPTFQEKDLSSEKAFIEQMQVAL
ncbi:hypothetical protein [Reichenbachiella sp. MALMAid0571]|uniref:hypothetical protein n=1 Tax=Reichenbachiella sp. MALMAid0571 TaxID=3143939 RepID=UPI0032E0285E